MTSRDEELVGARAESLSSLDRLRLDGVIDLVVGLALVLAAVIRHHQVADGVGPAEYVLWTLAAVAGLRGMARLTAVIIAEDKAGFDPRP